jgi:glycosyltransferase involved in cell wall biosynthesis
MARGQGRRPVPELEKLEAEDSLPRVTLYEKRLESDVIDQSDLSRVPGARGLLYRQLPPGAALALLAFEKRKRYDAVVSWAEAYGLPFAALLKLTGARVPHVALFSWLSVPKKAAVLRRVHSHIHRLVLWSTVQYEYAVQEIGIPPERIVQLRWLVDEKFWRPMPGPTDMICAAGREMRDYATLVEAIRDWPVPFHIAANAGPNRSDRWMTDLARLGELPGHITIGAKPYAELRALYARSRFVVIPLLPTDTDNGITVMTEAMAMGKAVICTRVAGQRDLLEDGVNGLLVPPNDPRALRRAMEHLWSRPEECERMGREGRRRVERDHTLDRFVEGVHRAVESAIEDVRGTPRHAGLPE